MNHGKTFLICSSVILVLSVINLSVGPIINRKVGNWSFRNCGKISDNFDEKRKNNDPIDKIKAKERELSQCRHRKPMSILEEMSFVTNLIIGLICFLFGSIGLEKELKTRMGIVAMAFGVIGFIITFLYVIFNGIVYTNYYDDDIYKIDEDGAFAELVGDKYKCFYFSEANDEYPLIAKFSDLIKSQYNYNKELKDAFKNENYEQYNCQYNDPSSCIENGYIDLPSKNCRKLYYSRSLSDYYTNFDKSSRLLACLILSILILLCHLCLAFCGFLIFKET